MILTKAFGITTITALVSLVSQVDANGNITAMTYDKLGRMVQRQDYRDNDSNPATTATTLEANTVWLYDTLGAGRLTKVDDTVSNYQAKLHLR